MIGIALIFCPTAVNEAAFVSRPEPMRTAVFFRLRHVLLAFEWIGGAKGRAKYNQPRWPVHFQFFMQSFWKIVSLLTILREASIVRATMTKKVKITPSVAEQTLIRLMRVGDRLWRESDNRFGQWGLTDNHYNVLRILNGSAEPISQVEIGRKMLSSRANVTKLVDLLEDRKFVKRLSCGDRRVNLVDLTEEGAKFIEETLPEVIGVANEQLKPLTRDEQKTLFTLLGKLLEE